MVDRVRCSDISTLDGERRVRGVRFERMKKRALWKTRLNSIVSYKFDKILNWVKYLFFVGLDGLSALMRAMR